MADETSVTPTATPAAPAPQPDEGLLHELATSAGLDPEAIVATAKAIRQHPWQVAKEVGSAQAGEFVDAGHHLRDTALSALNGVASAITNPEAKATAIARLKSPGLINKIQGAEEYATAAVPLVGGNYVKAEEQAGRGNIAGSIGTTLGTTLPLVTDTEGAEGIKAHLAETGKTFVESAKEGMQRAAVATAPEGSAEAGFAKIPGSKKVRGATPKPTVTSGEDVVTHIQNTAPDKISREEAHQRAGLDSGGDYRLTDIPTANLEAGDDYDPKLAQKYADKKGPLPAIVLDGDGRIRDGNHRVAAAQLRGEPTVKAYVPIDATETAPDKLAAVPGAKFVGKAPSPAEPVSAPAENAPAAEYHPDLQKVIDLPGVKVHTDPKQVTEAAHFVTPDGKFVRLPTGLDHDAAINTVKPDQTEYDPRINFINDTGAVRIRPTADKGGQNLAVQVPTQGITPEQVDTLKQAVGQGMKSRGNLTLETAAIPTDQKSEYKDVASPRDVEPMLRKIGAHPDQEPVATSKTGAKLPPQPKLPDTGTYPAIKTDDGGIYFDAHPEGRTHIMFAKEQGIPPERIVSGGWLKDGDYEGSERSDAGRWGEQARAKQAVAAKQLERAEFSPKGSDFVGEEFLPEGSEDKMYHVTTAKNKVLTDGLKSRKQTGSAGLGGGFMNQAPDKISVTFDEGHANQIAHRMNLAVQAAKDKVNPQQVLDTMISDAGIADDTPEEVGQMLGAPENVREDWEDFNKWVAENYKQGDSYSLLQELDDALPSIYTETTNPVRVGFTASKNQMAKIKPNQIHIFEVEARKGAKPEHIPDESELRFAPADVRVVQSSGKK